MFVLKIETGNDAFAGGDGPYELERILKEVGETLRLALVDVQQQEADGRLKDANGNRVGEWSLNAPEEEGGGALSFPPEDSGTAEGPADEDEAGQ